MQTQNPVFGQLFRQSYLAVSIQVTATAQKLTTLVETQLGLVPGSFAGIWREVQFQVDPETSAGATVRIGSGNLGKTIPPSTGAVQKGISLVGQSDTYRGHMNNIDVSTMWVMTTTGTAVLNCQFFAI